MDGKAFQEWWNNGPFHKEHPLYVYFKRISAWPVNLDYLLWLIRILETRDAAVNGPAFQTVRDNGLKALRENEVERDEFVSLWPLLEKVARRTGIAFLAAVRTKYFPEARDSSEILPREVQERLVKEIVALSMPPRLPLRRAKEPDYVLTLLWTKYDMAGYPPVRRGPHEDSWANFTLVAIVEHFIVTTNSPHYQGAMVLVRAARRQATSHPRHLRQAAIGRVKRFKNDFPDWQDGLELLWLQFACWPEFLPLHKVNDLQKKLI